MTRFAAADTVECKQVLIICIHFVFVDPYNTKKRGRGIMKIAVTSQGTNLDSQVDPRFGRAAYILIVDTKSLDFEVLDNKENANALKGAGIQAASMVSDKSAEVLLTGYCGPKAFMTLEAAKIRVANDIEGTVEDAVKAFNEGKVSFAEKANVEGQW
jgi:predicted Fe-Mo cluster-binding NifX family protein